MYCSKKWIHSLNCLDKGRSIAIEYNVSSNAVLGYLHTVIIQFRNPGTKCNRVTTECQVAITTDVLIVQQFSSYNKLLNSCRGRVSALRLAITIRSLLQIFFRFFPASTYPPSFSFLGNCTEQL